MSGRWRFHWEPTAADRMPGFEDPDFDDTGRADIAVPGHWQLHGLRRARPTPTSRYPFPVDPPHVPGREPDRRLPAARSTCRTDWPAGRGAALRRRRLVRSRSGSTATSSAGRTGSRLPTEFDVGAAAAAAARNVLAVRVHQWSAGSYLEDQDMWWLSGHLPRRHAARPAGGRRRRRVRARRLRPRTGAGHAARRTSACRRGSPSPSSGSTAPAGRAGRRSRRVEPWTRRDARGCTTASVRDRRRDGAAADRLPHGGDRGRPAHGQRAAASCSAASTGTSAHPEHGRAVPTRDACWPTCC